MIVAQSVPFMMMFLVVAILVRIVIQVRFISILEKVNILKCGLMGEEINMISVKELADTAMCVQDDILDGNTFYEVAQSMVWSAVDQFRSVRFQPVEEILGNSTDTILKEAMDKVEDYLKEDFDGNEDKMLAWARGEQ